MMNTTSEVHCACFRAPVQAERGNDIVCTCKEDQELCDSITEQVDEHQDAWTPGAAKDKVHNSK